MTRHTTVLMLLFALTFPAALAWFYFGQGGPMAKAAYSVGKVIQFSLPLLWWAIADRSRLRFSRPSSSGLMPAVLFGVAVALGAFALYFGWLKQHPLMDSLAKVTVASSVPVEDHSEPLCWPVAPAGL